MKKITLPNIVGIILFLNYLVLNAQIVFSQATFESTNDGNWSDTNSWMLVSGTSSTNYPVAGDDVTISAHTITLDLTNAQCSNLTIQNSGSLLVNTSLTTLIVSNNFSLNNSTFDVSASGTAVLVLVNMSVSNKATITQTLGTITVVGLVGLTAPIAGTGTSLIDIQGGLFSCGAGMTITGATSTRTAELKIGGGSVNIGLFLATINANSKITFTGVGSLIIVGSLTIPNPSSFTAGSGVVTFAGVLGIDQTVTPLTYNRLVISGAGNGNRVIEGNVTVTDTLTLLSDTLDINTGGQLVMNNGTAITRTQGRIISNAPTFSGVIDLIYNNPVSADTTGLELPSSTSVLRNLDINNVFGVQLDKNTAVNGTLHLQNGTLKTDIYSLEVTTNTGGVASDDIVLRTNGYIEGSLTRQIGTSTGVRFFPVGVGLVNFRGVSIDYTSAPSNTGKLTVTHYDTDADNHSGLPIDDDGVDITSVAPMYWQVEATDGLEGGIYTLQLTAQGIDYVEDINGLRTVKRPSSGGDWVVDGIQGTNTGDENNPTLVREGMSGFSVFGIGGDSNNPLPLFLHEFNAKRINNGEVSFNWVTSSEYQILGFELEFSANGFDFEKLSWIKSKGNFHEKNHYNKTITFVNEGYFRLKIIEETQSSFSDVIFLPSTSQILISFFPNPNIDRKIFVKGISYSNYTALINLYDLHGNFLYSSKLESENLSIYSANLPESLSCGVYILQILSENLIFTEKLIID
jgi:hypothetical protein